MDKYKTIIGQGETIYGFRSSYKCELLTWGAA